eukprot:TRINITY_DN7859_c0_g1_i2.p1 TRINITY_DN7859_c0_g1~~TRINITY_DN7859_c0_g1_i2.p1  ORF type:complete len:105 (+),score=7.43 TRINITY_DN7859_c0_g1_i2:26-340(+)
MASSYYCDLCSKNFGSNKTFTAHQGSLKHQNRLFRSEEQSRQISAIQHNRKKVATIARELGPVLTQYQEDTANISLKLYKSTFDDTQPTSYISPISITYLAFKD